ncbi:hypothetical protein Dimus_026944, partial [Dionaea muscipula]
PSFVEDLVSTEERRCKRFEAGLRPGIKDRLVALRLRIFSDLLELARAVERTLAANQKIKEGCSRLRTSGATSDSRPTKKEKSSSTGSFPIQTNPSRPAQSFSASSRGVSGQSSRGEIICYQCHQLDTVHPNALGENRGRSFDRRPTTSGQQNEVPIICFQCGQPGHTRRSCPSRFGAQDGAVSLPAQSSQFAPTLQAFRPAQPTHSAHSTHSVQVSGTGTRRAPAIDTLRGGPSTQLTQGRVYAIGSISAPEVVADNGFGMVDEKSTPFNLEVVLASSKTEEDRAGSKGRENIEDIDREDEERDTPILICLPELNLTVADPSGCSII